MSGQLGIMNRVGDGALQLALGGVQKPYRRGNQQKIQKTEHFAVPEMGERNQNVRKCFSDLLPNTHFHIETDYLSSFFFSSLAGAALGTAKIEDFSKRTLTFSEISTMKESSFTSRSLP